MSTSNTIGSVVITMGFADSSESTVAPRGIATFSTAAASASSSASQVKPPTSTLSPLSVVDKNGEIKSDKGGDEAKTGASVLDKHRRRLTVWHDGTSIALFFHGEAEYYIVSSWDELDECLRIMRDQMVVSFIRLKKGKCPTVAECRLRLGSEHNAWISGKRGTSVFEHLGIWWYSNVVDLKLAVASCLASATVEVQY